MVSRILIHAFDVFNDGHGILIVVPNLRKGMALAKSRSFEDVQEKAFGAILIQSFGQLNKKTGLSGFSGSQTLTTNTKYPILTNFIVNFLTFTYYLRVKIRYLVFLSRSSGSSKTIKMGSGIWKSAIYTMSGGNGRHSEMQKCWQLRAIEKKLQYWVDRKVFTHQ